MRAWHQHVLTNCKESSFLLSLSSLPQSSILDDTARLIVNHECDLLTNPPQIPSIVSPMLGQ